MRRKGAIFLFIAVLLGSISSANSAENRRLVLVTDEESGLHSLSASETRKLFLGLPVIKQGRSLEAIINRSDPFLYEVFLQKIVYMSAPVYERHLLSNMVQVGGQRPQAFNDVHTLISTLKEYPGTVTLLWEKDAKAHRGLTILGEIWHGKAE